MLIAHQKNISACISRKIDQRYTIRSSVWRAPFHSYMLTYDLKWVHYYDYYKIYNVHSF